MQSSAAQRLERLAAAWARRRQGKDSGAVVLTRRRIYILPSGFGVAFGVMVFAMLLGSLNYGASLGFALTFLLGGLGLVAMHHCHNNLLGAELRFVGAYPVFAGQRAEFRLAVGNAAMMPRYEIEVGHGGHVAGPADVPAGGSALLKLEVPTERRGVVRLERCTVATRHPGRLFRAWTWLHMDARCIVYPRPAAPGRPLPRGPAGGVRGKPDPGDADFAGLRAAAPGDPPQRIAWKAYARSEALLLKQFANGDGEPCVLDWDDLPDLAPEPRLEQLARWCLDAHAEARSFELKLRDKRLPLGAGERHLADCLEALALFEAAS